MSRITIIQPALPAYRVDFFGRLAETYGHRLAVYHAPTVDPSLRPRRGLDWACCTGPVRPILPGLLWQSGVANIPLSRGDILIVNGNPRILSTLVLLVRARILGVRSVWWGHYWSSTTKTWRHNLRRKLMRLSDALLFYTDLEVAEFHATSFAQGRKPVAALNNGIDTDPIIQHRLPYNADARGRSLLFIGRLTAKARLDLALEALALPAVQGVTLHVIGEGEEQQRLHDLSVSLGLGPRVRWHGATTDEGKIARVANRCRAFLYPGSVGLSLIHAMAYGLPAILHGDRWRHMPEIAAFEDGATGVLFEPGNAEDLALKISDLLSDAERLQDLSDRAIAITNVTYNTRDMADRFTALVDQLERGA